MPKTNDSISCNLKLCKYCLANSHSALIFNEILIAALTTTDITNTCQNNNFLQMLKTEHENMYRQNVDIHIKCFISQLCKLNYGNANADKTWLNVDIN
jgi:hypothetical protein